MKRVLLLLGVITLCSRAAFAAVAFDAAASGTPSAGVAAGTYSFSHTIGGGTNRLFVLWVTGYDASSFTLTATYNGTSMTRITGCAFGEGAFQETIVGFYIKEASLPGAGTYTVATTFTGGGGTLDFMTAVGSSWTGVDQPNPLLNGQGGAYSGNPSTTPTQTITNASGNVALDCIIWQSASITATASQTQRNNSTSGSANFNMASQSATTVNPAMGWTMSSLSNTWLSGVSIANSTGRRRVHISDLLRPMSEFMAFIRGNR